MSDDILEKNSKIKEYIKKFGSSEKFIRKILDSISGEFNIINMETFDVEVSNSDNFYSGIKCYEMIKKCSDKCDENDCILKRVLLSKKKEIIKGRHNPRETPLEIHGYPIMDEKGDVASVIIHEMDISEREKLKENYEMLYDNLEDCFSLNKMIYKNGSASDWIVLKANKAYKKLFGEHVEGMRASEINSDLFARYIDHFEKALRKNKIQKTKIPIKLRGKSFDIITFKTRKDHFVNLTRDVTDKQVGEDKVKEIEERFYGILQNSQDLVYRYNFKEDKFDYVSESVFTILGYPLGEFMEMNRKDFESKIHPNDIHKLKIEESLEAEVSSIVEYRFKKRDGGYIWLRVKRVIFRDEKGELAYSVGDMMDITSEKLVEEEKTRLEEKIIQIRGKELGAKERITLTDKEKIVLWGLCRYPLLNDEELAKKLDLKRSTFTAIKNRIKGKKWFSLIYLPNFYKLGCQFFSIFEGNLSKSAKVKTLNLSLVKEAPEVILNNYQDDRFFGVFVSDRYVSFKKFLETFIEDNKDIFRMGVRESSFFYGLDSVELRDMSNMINSLFNLGMKEKSAVYTFEKEGKGLNINEKRVLLTMIKNSEMSSAEISKKVWISKPTVIKIRKKLLGEGYVYPFIFPDFKKLGFPYIARFSFEFDSELPKEVRKDEKDSRIILRTIEKKKLTKFMLFMSEEEYMEEVELLQDVYRRSGIYFKLDNELFPIQKRHSNNFQLGAFLDELLFRDEI